MVLFFTEQTNCVSQIMREDLTVFKGHSDSVKSFLVFWSLKFRRIATDSVFVISKNFISEESYVLINPI